MVLVSRCFAAPVSILVLVDVALEPKDRDFPTRERSVSILVLVDVALERNHAPGRAPRDPEFQSLFSWMSLLNDDDSRFCEIPGRFQSLFSWMSLLNEYQGRRGKGVDGVSILVLVDVALERTALSA